MHAYNANDAVRHFTGGSHIFPCAYVFPVSSFSAAIALAQTFTDMYLGLLTNIQQRTARSLGQVSHSIIYVMAQALGQEGQQSGWYRSLQGKPASAQPFLTSSTRDLVFSWLHRFIVPGSCPNLDAIPLQTTPPLDLVRRSSHVPSSEKVTLRAPGSVNPCHHRVAYVNGALVPTVVPVDVVRVVRHGGRVRESIITADFPLQHNVMHGLTLAAVVRQDEKRFITAEDVSDAAVYGPAVIEV